VHQAAGRQESEDRRNKGWYEIVSMWILRFSLRLSVFVFSFKKIFPDLIFIIKGILPDFMYFSDINKVP